MENKYFDKIKDAGFEIYLLDKIVKSKHGWFIQGYEGGHFKIIRGFEKKKDAVIYLRNLLSCNTFISVGLTKDDRDKLINKGFTFYRLRADHSIWFMDASYREWKLFSRFTAEDQAKKELASLLEDKFALED